MATSSSSGKCCSTSQEEFTTWRHLLSKEKNCLKGWQTSLETQKKTASQALFSSHISLPFFFFCWFLNSHSYKVILSLLQLYFTKQLHNLTALSPDLSKNKQTSSWKHVTFPVKFFVLACKIHLLFKFLKLPCSHLTLNKQQQKKAKPKHSCFFHQSSSSLRILHITSF